MLGQLHLDGLQADRQRVQPQSRAIKGLKDLHWTVVAQLLRRGGLKSGPKVDPASVDGRIAQLRAQAKAEDASKRAGNGAPDEYTRLQCTALEEGLHEALRGPDASWLEDCKEGEPFAWGPAETQDPGAEAQRQALQATEGEELTRLSAASAHLQSHVRAKLAQAHRGGHETQLREILAQAVREGCPRLAREAADILDSDESFKAGSPAEVPDVEPSQVAWDGQSRLGRGTATVLGKT